MTSLSCGSDTQGSYPFSQLPSQISPAFSLFTSLGSLHDYPQVSVHTHKAQALSCPDLGYQGM